MLTMHCESDSHLQPTIPLWNLLESNDRSAIKTGAGKARPGGQIRPGVYTISQQPLPALIQLVSMETPGVAGL